MEWDSGSVVNEVQEDACGRITNIILELISTVCSEVKIKIIPRSIFGKKAYIVANTCNNVSVLSSQDFT